MASLDRSMAPSSDSSASRLCGGTRGEADPRTDRRPTSDSACTIRPLRSARWPVWCQRKTLLILGPDCGFPVDAGPGFTHEHAFGVYPGAVTAAAQPPGTTSTV